jgi:hypothetical protein
MKPVSFRYFAPRAVDDALDAADPTWRARSLSVYRFWRDLGYAIGVLTAGLLAATVGFACWRAQRTSTQRHRRAIARAPTRRSRTLIQKLKAVPLDKFPGRLNEELQPVAANLKDAQSALKNAKEGTEKLRDSLNSKEIEARKQDFQTRFEVWTGKPD